MGRHACGSLAGACILSAATHLLYPDGSSSVTKLHRVTSQNYCYLLLSEKQILLSLLLSFERDFEQKGQLSYRRRNGKTKVRGMIQSGEIRVRKERWREGGREGGRKEGRKEGCTDMNCIK